MVCSVPPPPPPGKFTLGEELEGEGRGLTHLGKSLSELEDLNQVGGGPGGGGGRMQVGSGAGT